MRNKSGKRMLTRVELNQCHTGSLNALTSGEIEQLKKCECVLQKGLGTFFEVGLALLTIRDARLYRDSFSTFEWYCKERWGMGRHYAWRLIGAAERLKLLPPETEAPRPVNEFQIRPFLRLQPEMFPQAWEQVLARSKDGRITQELIRRLIDELSPQKRAATAAKKQRKRLILPKGCSIGEVIVLLGEAKKGIEIGDTDKALVVIGRIEALVLGL